MGCIQLSVAGAAHRHVVLRVERVRTSAHRAPLIRVAVVVSPLLRRCATRTRLLGRLAAGRDGALVCAAVTDDGTAAGLDEQDASLAAEAAAGPGDAGPQARSRSRRLRAAVAGAAPHRTAARARSDTTEGDEAPKPDAFEAERC